MFDCFASGHLSEFTQSVRFAFWPVLPDGRFYRQIWSKLAKFDPLWLFPFTFGYFPDLAKCLAILTLYGWCSKFPTKWHILPKKPPNFFKKWQIVQLKIIHLIKFSQKIGLTINLFNAWNCSSRILPHYLSFRGKINAWNLANLLAISES